VIELSITVKDEDRRFIKKELLYGELLLSRDNPILIDKLQAVLKEMNADPHDPALDIIINPKMVWQ
jgi:hypothetical protein